MARDAFSRVLSGEPKGLDRPPVTGRVVKVTADGAWVAPVGTAVDEPIGPCRGPAAVAVGDVVLLITTDAGPWVAQIAGA